MDTIKLIAPCHFGLEAVLKKEIYDLGYDIAEVDDGRVTFIGDEQAIARANVFLRSAQRILIEAGSFKAESFEELFDRTAEIEWERYIPKDGRFWVAKASSVKSKLFSPSDIQSIMKKAMVRRLSGIYGIEHFPETGDPYPLRVFIKKDRVTVGLDTTGESLHKRGYRKLSSKAPIAENLAAALIMLTPWKAGRILADPFCGSGTVPIEAAMMAANIAPGMNREFTSMDWANIIEKKHWYEAFDEARDLVDMSVKTEILGSDIDPDMIKIAKQNAKMAGVEGLISFRCGDMAEFSHPGSYGFMITNPPYGERLMAEDELAPLYAALGRSIDRLDNWSAYIITSYENAEKHMKKKAAKNRKIYNGMIKTYYYMFPGRKPGK